MSASIDVPPSDRLSSAAARFVGSLTERERRLEASILAEVDARIDARVAEALASAFNRSYDA